MQRVITMGSMRGTSSSPLALVSSETPATTWPTLAMWCVLAFSGAYLLDMATKGRLSGLLHLPPL